MLIQTDTCIDNSDSDSNYYYSGNYRIKAEWKLNNYHPFMSPYFKAKTTSYKKRRGRWKKWRTYMEVTIQGAVRPANDCFYFETVNKKKTGRKKRIKAVERAPQNYRKVLQSELWNINKHNGTQNILYLTW